ncbi:MAG: hypothetical protein J5833_04575 [Victivallales bacterium]|nr:hypothetical protein [Victivallales bacterium]
MTVKLRYVCLAAMLSVCLTSCIGIKSPSSEGVETTAREKPLFQLGGELPPEPTVVLDKYAEWVQTPGFGHGIEFHGNGDCARVPNFPVESLGSNATISLFLKVSAFPKPRPNGDQWAGAFFSSEYKWLGRVYSRQAIYGGLCNETGALKGIFSTQTLETGRWYHFAAVYDSDAKLFVTYLNGERCGLRSDEITPLGKLTPGRFVLGGDPDGCWFNGTVADLRVYGRAFSPTEIMALAKRAEKPFTAAPNCAGGFSFVPDVFSGVPILPESRIDEELMGNRLEFTATPGEYEPATFVLRMMQDAQKVVFETSDLKGAKGTRIPASALDLRIVKCWYQGPAAWRNEAAGKRPPILVPELLLKDDALVRVDYEKEENWLRHGRGTDAKYENVSTLDDNNNFWQKTMTVSEYPIYDAKELQPIDLKAGRNQQFHVLLHVPENTAPGEYAGTIAVKSGGRRLAEFKVRVRVLPFTLPQPRTCYDIDKPYYTSIYYNSVLIDDERAGITSYYRNAEQIKAELANLVAHGVMYPTSYQLNSPEKRQDVADVAFRRMLRLRKEAGMPNRPIHLISNPKINMHDLTTSEEDLAKLTAKATEYLNVVEQELGHRDVFFYGLDEAKGDALREGIPFFRAIQKSGARTFNSGYMAKTLPPGNFAVVGDVLDLLICCAESDPAEAERWHSKKHEIWSYGYPQSSNENPLPFRRNFGYVIYKCNYDGVCTFCYYLGFGHPWNDFDSTIQRDMNFVYPTADGVVDTVAFEGVREGFDDVRYVTLMRLEARDAMNSGDQRRIAAAKEAEADFQSRNVYLDSPAKTRAAVIQHILRLQKLAGKLPK